MGAFSILAGYLAFSFFNFDQDRGKNNHSWFSVFIEMVFQAGILYIDLLLCLLSSLEIVEA